MLCLGHHAMVTRTQMLSKEWPELLRVLWREQHPEAHEQTIMNFAVKPVAVKLVPLFSEDRLRSPQKSHLHPPKLANALVLIPKAAPEMTSIGADFSRRPGERNSLYGREPYSDGQTPGD
ncbi:hypothetical protein BDD14_5536 [Edaphobacter modestus]|uniref:Uncharacterized protein n=1 Tax=Edaphobacter modestus TaxID=388466 RepID=A0A4Q7YFU2_9BACT|nr:hypothetical protein BDD14_5536 [Edaphobacter modestus]